MRYPVWILLLFVAVLMSACSNDDPFEEEVLVVEAFVTAGKPLPPVFLRQTLPLSLPYIEDGSHANDALVTVYVDGTPHPYRLQSDGRYLPAFPSDEPVEEGAQLQLEIDWRGRHVSAKGVVPGVIALDSIHVVVPAEPVEGVVLDSLNLDSLVIERGWLYPVEVTMYWQGQRSEVRSDTSRWIRTDLHPRSSALNEVNFFLNPGQVLREETIRHNGNTYFWKGLYAVPVADRTDRLPEHDLRVALIRSGLDYARFASSRDAPTRREPVTNIKGGIGIFAGIAIDSLNVKVVPRSP